MGNTPPGAPRGGGVGSPLPPQAAPGQSLRAAGWEGGKSRPSPSARPAASAALPAAPRSRFGGAPPALSRGQPCPRGVSSRAPPASISTSTRERFAQSQFFPVCYEGTVATAKLGALGTFRQSAQSTLSLLEILPFRPWHP